MSGLEHDLFRQSEMYCIKMRAVMQQPKSIQSSPECMGSTLHAFEKLLRPSRSMQRYSIVTAEKDLQWL